MKQIIIIAILALALFIPAQAFAIHEGTTTISNKPTQLIDNCKNPKETCISTVAANGTIIIMPRTPPPVQQPLKTEVVEEVTTDEGDGEEVPRQSSGDEEEESNESGDDGGRYVGECEGQSAPDYPDYCSDPKDLDEDSGYDDDDNAVGEVTEGYEEDDGYIDENNDGNYDVGEE